MIRRNQSALPLLALVPWAVWVALAFAIPILIFGLGATIRAISFMFSKPMTGVIPVWSIFVVGLLVLIARRRRYF